MEETQAGRSAIRFTVNKKNSSKSYGKKYWGTHVRPLKGTKLKPPPHERGSSSEEREGRAKKRESDRQSSIDNKMDVTRKLKHEREVMNEDKGKHKEKTVELKMDVEEKKSSCKTHRKGHGIDKIRRKNW